MPYISEFEELLKLRIFAEIPNSRVPFENTKEIISKALINEYIGNIEEKINRWVSVTCIPFFKEAKPIKYYFQSKMLFRDGFYESAIALSRSICEMICYDLIKNNNHPFTDIEQTDIPMFRILLNFLVIPKNINRTSFEMSIISKIKNIDDLNFMKSAYLFDKLKNYYRFKIECGSKNKNLERYLNIFKEINYLEFDNLSFKAHQYLHQIYDIGNKYIHAKESNFIPKNDAYACLEMLTHILHEVYAIKDTIIGGKIKSGYMDFPDICDGMSYSLEAADTPEEALRIYYNLPTNNQVKKMCSIVGVWEGEWKDAIGSNHKGILEFYKEAEKYLCANLKYIDENNINNIECLQIKLFGAYFHLIGFDEKTKKHIKNKHVYFEMELFKDNIILGESVENKSRLMFKKLYISK
ncbi:hypothetical protein [Methanoculleus sp.]|uniref:hypothetical protein n=1 Tax=Methanoculleus sp. TaxID=90427 RepID=UPI0025F270C6|nr:hypothetical protein [Methanoculleus sp.]MCK9320024.1 hypothetical protein [Methanoculleus sp.]